MHVSQSEGESTDRDQGAAERGRAAYDWSEADVSGVSEDDFPISCNECEYPLTGLGDTGRCPECGAAFDRRRRLWEFYGPEAFARPPIADGESGAAPRDRRFVVAVFTAVVCAVAIPIGVLIWREVSGTVDRWLCLAAWSVMAACVEWIILNRVGSGRKEEEEG